MVQIGVLRLAPKNFVIYRDTVDFVTTVINLVDSDWAEHQEHLKTDSEPQPFYSDAHRDYVNRIRPWWDSFLQLPMFQVRVETPGAPRSGIHRTVAPMIDRVQAR